MAAPGAAPVSMAAPGAAPVTIVDCQGCGACLLTCPRRAIRPVTGPAAGATRPGSAAPAGHAVLVVLADRCDGCAECVEVCPVGAVHLTVPTLIGGAA